MRKKKILLAHNNPDFVKRIQKDYELNKFFSLAGTATDGQSLLSYGSLDHFDIVIVKNALTYVTGLYALEILLKNTKQRPTVIILITPFINEFVIGKCDRLEIDYLPEFKIEDSKITDIIYYSELNRSNKNKMHFEPSVEIIRLLKQVGLLRTYIGYTYFEYALNFMFENNTNIYKSMKELYTIISTHFDVTITSVEKAMRTCLKSSLAQSNTFYSRLLFGHSVEKSDFPSTSMFIQVCIKTLKELKQTILNNNMRNSVRKI